MPQLPIYTILSQLRDTLEKSRVCVLCGPPGSGKTTVAPLALLEEEWLGDHTILLVEPRRLAARMTASYMASQMGEQVGQTVGYQVRFDRKITKQSKIEVITEGILTRRLQKDPELPNVGLVIFDEFHERSLQSDTALALCLDSIEALRDDLRLMIMSATMDTGAISQLLNGAPILSCQGTMYPVEVIHKPPLRGIDSNRSDLVALNVAGAVRLALTETQGDILAFLPGAGEIRQAVSALSHEVEKNDVVLLPLYGDLSLADQSRAVQPDPDGRRRVILSTSIAETSLTIEGISTVIDCGWKRVPQFDPNCGLTRLDTVRISQASATQRQGRAGRLGPGVCYRLWGREVEHGLREYDRPEILEADLAGLVLQLAEWGCDKPELLKWLDPPPMGSYSQARSLLMLLEALDLNGRITPMGKKMVSLPLYPRLAHMILMAEQYGCLPLACDLAALLTERDILIDRERGVDIIDRLHIMDIYRTEGSSAARTLGADVKRCRQVNRISKQLIGLLPNKPRRKNKSCQAGTLLALAFPDRLARQSNKVSQRYKLVSGRGAYLQKHDPISFSSYLVIADMDAGKREGRIFMAAALDKQDVDDLFSNHFDQIDETTWNEKTQTVVSRQVIKLGELVVDEKQVHDPDPEDVHQALIKGIRQTGLEILPWNKTARSLMERINSLRIWQPEEEWPDLSDAHLLASLAEWLGPYLTGLRSGNDLQSLNMTEILLGRLDWNMRKKLDIDAPTHVRVPSGSRIPLWYKAGEPPVLAVRLQEMFGLEDTPTVCQGQVPVVLHLLSPARRPIQVTSDLRSFWDSSYYEVKKDLKGRYPKHYWPDDPWQATPTRRVRPKK